MHNVHLGNAHYLINKLFSKKAKGMALQTAADSVLEGIRPPNYIERGPRTFCDVSFWKAHKWSNWLY